MGNENRLDAVKGEAEAPFAAHLAIVAAESQLDALSSRKGMGWLGDAEYIPLAIDETLDPSVFRASDIAVIEIDPDVPGSMGRIQTIRDYDRELPVVAAMRSADISMVRTLVRSGVADVVSVPLDPEELLQCVIAIAEVRAQSVAGSVKQAPVIAVAKAMGGCGATTIATHLAAALGDHEAELPNVCLMDLDIQFGNDGEYVDLAPRRNLSDLLNAGSRLDAAFLRSVTAEHEAGFSLVAAPPDIDPIESIAPQQLDAIIRTARREFEHVIADMPTDLTNWGLSFLSSADLVLLVVEPKVAAIKQAKRRLDLFRNVGLDLRRVAIVINKEPKRLFGGISKSDVEETLHRDVMKALHLDDKNIPTAQEQGLLAYEWRTKSPFWTEMVELADLIRVKLDDGGRA